MLSDGPSRCPLCNGEAPRPLMTLGHREIARCAGCGHTYAARFDGDALAHEYRDAYYADPDDPRIAAWAESHRPVWDALVEQIGRLRPEIRSLLDVGAGTGGFLARMRARRPDVALAAVEPSAAARTALERRLEAIRFPTDRAEQLGEVTESFDAVTMLQTLEHLQDPLAACRGARHCLRPGGLLLLTVPNRRSLDVLLHRRRAGCWANGTHLQFFDRKRLVAMLRRAGFARVQRVAGFGGGQHSTLVRKLPQYALRLCGWSSELRYAARREATWDGCATPPAASPPSPSGCPSA